MRITLLATGKCKDKSINALSAEYIKRLGPYAAVNIVELAQAKANTADEIKRQECAAQLAKIKEGAYVIALDERGKSFTTRALATHLEKEQTNGMRDVVIVIGGAEGLHDDIRQRAQLVLSLSALTFPHMMVKPIILEQLYRVCSVIAGHPYHRD